METNIRAHELPPSEVICRDGRPRPRTMAAVPNYLSFHPRPVPKNQKCFENDGPGSLSAAGVRHDNDFVNVRDIRILPTTDEILSLRAPYMPYKRFNKPHFLERGPERIIDTLFRQLRHDNVERLKDCVYAAAQKLCSTDAPPEDYDPCQETPAGNRYYMYWGAEFEDLRFEDRKGLIVQFSYNCPKSMRRRKMFTSGRLEKGMLMAAVGLDDDGVSLSATFFEIFLPQCTESMEIRGGNGVKAAVQLLFAQKECEEDITRMVFYAQKINTGRFVLVEFPKHLLSGFYPILKRIQEFSSRDFAFTRYFAPRNLEEENIGSLPPSYVDQESSFLDCNAMRKNIERNSHLEKHPLRDLIKDKKKFLEIVKSETTLDEGQAEAFVDTLTNEITFVQGPPGTGKTFLGVALTKAILAAGKSGEKPILAVCMTNHALDSFLKDLVDQGITQIARLGCGSKEEWTAKYNLRSLVMSVKSTERERIERCKVLHEVRSLSTDGIDICDSVNTPERVGWFTIAQHLEANERYHPILNQLVIAARPDDGLHKKGLDRKAGAFPYVFWSSGGDLKVFDMSLAEEFALFLGQNDPDGKNSLTNSDIVSNVLCDIISKIQMNSQWAEENIWKLPFTERKALIAKWAKEIDQKAVARNIIDVHFKHQEAVNQLKATSRSADLRCLEKQKVIGMTTTACASNWDLLQRLNPEVVMCEEAGEVMEAHTLCTLFPSLKHAIFIGDPLQLRPQISEQSLSLETKNGQEYRLDESLFERLMDPNSGIRTLPHSRLTIQRRMHPDISDCVRKTLYPFLVDHPSTYTHPEVGGLSHRTFWLDHNSPEEKSAASSRTTKSFCNQFEVEMVCGLVRYLINTNSYGLGDIAVLTPYNGQLAQLVRNLHSTASLYLSDQDKATLLDEGFLEEKDLDSEGRLDVDMIDMLRASTIDNFQGEEAKIVILSTVRSNVENRPGFLKTSNRINVACSRARDGFYIFGSSKCLEQVPMWKDIINIFKESGRLGSSLHMTPCSREPKHCDTVFEIKEPSDFDDIPPCETTCGAILSCGHTCTEKCHPPELHETNSIKCKEPCNKIHPDCGHPCEKACGEDCGTCTVEKGTTNLDCGHIGVVTCDIDYWGVVPKCNAMVREVSLGCGHKLPVKCGEKDKEPVCVDNCAAVLPCGHECKGKCMRCQETGHLPCVGKCNKELSCSHKCVFDCHGTSPCPPCQHPCERSCPHGKCENKCSQPCDPCLRITTHGCKHRKEISALCCLSSYFPPCNEYTYVHHGECGHRVPVLCGEKAPKNCIQCETGAPPAVPTINLPCGHDMELDNLETSAEISNSGNLEEKKGSANPPSGGHLKTIDLTCSECGRLARASQTEIPKLAEVADKLITKMAQYIGILGKRLTYHEVMLRNSFPSLKQGLRSSPLGFAANQQLISERFRGLTEAQDHIAAIREDLVIPAEENLSYLMQFYRDQDLILTYNLQFKLRFDLLFRRARHAFLKDVLDIVKVLKTFNDPSYPVEFLAASLCSTVKVHGQDNIDNLTKPIADCVSKRLPCLEVELRLLQLSFQCLLQAAADVDGSSRRYIYSDASMKRVLNLCQMYPHTAGLYKQQAESIKISLKTGKSPGPIFMEQTRAAEQKWRECVPGSITTCTESHPYPAAAFEGCPECGKKVTSEEPNYEQHLHEDKFLDWMRNRGSAVNTKE